MGGGTFDVSILDVGAGVVEVIASAGDPRLGGDDWDRTIQEWLEDEFVREHGANEERMEPSGRTVPRLLSGYSQGTLSVLRARPTCG